MLKWAFFGLKIIVTQPGKFPTIAPLAKPAVAWNGVGGVMDSTLVTKPKVHVVMTANHVNPKLYLNSRKRRFLRFSSLIAANGL